MRTTTITSTALQIALAITLSGCLGEEGKEPLDAEVQPFGWIPADEMQRMQDQAVLKDAAAILRGAVEAGDDDGYTGISLEDGLVVLWWNGAPGPTMQANIERARAIAPVEVRAAPHSLEQLRTAAAELDRALQADPGAGFHSVQIPVDGRGLVLATSKPVAVPRLDVPVERVAREAMLPASRFEDYAPFWGGTRIVNSNQGNYCTGGWGVRSTIDNRRYLLTAAHCGYTGGNWRTHAGLHIGTVTHERADHDVMLIEANVGGQIYDGGVYTEWSKKVAGWDWVYAGEYLCGSGSVTGAHCSAHITDNFVYSFCDTDYFGTYECYYDLVLGDYWGNAGHFWFGDSGCPIFYPRSDGKVIAKGTLTGIDGTSTGSYGYFMFQDFATARADFSITPVTE